MYKALDIVRSGVFPLEPISAMSIASLVIVTAVSGSLARCKTAAAASRNVLLELPSLLRVAFSFISL